MYLVFLVEYVEQLFTTTAKSMLSQNLEEKIAELQEKTSPPLTADFEKETRDDAIKKRNERIAMFTLEVPPTCAGKIFDNIYTIK